MLVLNRRELIGRTGLGAVALGSGGLSGAIGALADTIQLPFGNGERALVKYPQKRPLIQMTTRPPQLETPFSVFNEGVITPNDAFFVRYHLSQVPTSIDPANFTLTVNGSVNSPLTLSLEELQTKFEPVALVAVSPCS